MGQLCRNSHHCDLCALPLPRGTPRCGACLARPPPFARTLAPWLYEDYLAYIIGRWKYAGQRRLTPLLADLWLEAAGSDGRMDLLVPVPLHWRRRWQRGFNQSELLSRELLALGAANALAPTLVKRRRQTPAQQGLHADERRRNLRGAFTVSKPCDNLRLAVVDDVLTTGATASAVARALRDAGAGHVEIWCLARTPAPGN
jgi:ComF family protein